MTVSEGLAVQGALYVIGLGPGDPLDLPAVNLSLMRGRQVYLRTRQHPVAAFLKAEGIIISPLDYFYEQEESFDSVYRNMAGFLIAAAQAESQPVIFGVPGHPLVGETVVKILLQMAPEKGVPVRLWSAPSFLEACYRILNLDPAQGLMILDGFQISSSQISPATGVLVCQVYNRALASEVKLALMERFPDDHPLHVIRAAGVRGLEKMRVIPLYELDRLPDLDHLTTVYTPPLQRADGLSAAGNLIGIGTASPPYTLEPLVEVMECLLGTGGCPWDRQQTHLSLKQYLIEEAYEVTDAIDEGNMHKLCEELGDLLLQVVFHSMLAEGRGDFTLQEVVSGITEKLKRRHPHVFGEKHVNSAAEVVKNWEAIKQEEDDGAKRTGHGRSLLAGVPRDLPALQRAQKVQGKAALVGFDWPDAAGAALKLEEEWQEVKSAWGQGDREGVRQELGDLFFAMVNVARLLQVNAEETLRAAVDKFSRRFRTMEIVAFERGSRLDACSLEELDKLWNEVKAKED